MEEGIAVVVTGKSGVVVRTEKSLSSEKVVELAVGTRAVQISTSSITNADGGEVERAAERERPSEKSSVSSTPKEPEWFFSLERGGRDEHPLQHDDTAAVARDVRAHAEAIPDRLGESKRRRHHHNHKGKWADAVHLHRCHDNF